MNAKGKDRTCVPRLQTDCPARLHSAPFNVSQVARKAQGAGSGVGKRGWSGNPGWSSCCGPLIQYRCRRGVFDPKRGHETEHETPGRRGHETGSSERGSWKLAILTTSNNCLTANHRPRTSTSSSTSTALQTDSPEYNVNYVGYITLRTGATSITKDEERKALCNILQCMIGLRSTGLRGMLSLNTARDGVGSFHETQD